MRSHKHMAERMCKQKEMSCISCYSSLNQEAFVDANLSHYLHC